MKWNDATGFYMQDAWNPNQLGWMTGQAPQQPAMPGLNYMDALGQNNPAQNYAQTGVAGYEQPNPQPVAMQPQQNALSRLMTGGYQGPQLKSMWQGYRPQARGMYRMGG